VKGLLLRYKKANLTDLPFECTLLFFDYTLLMTFKRLPPFQCMYDKMTFCIVACKRKFMACDTSQAFSRDCSTV
jgi:hypothetical protein